MSCAVFLYCRRCESESSFEENHGQKSLSAIWKAREHIIAIREIQEVWDIELRLNCQHIDIDWLIEHNEHEVVCIDEYGHLYDLDGNQIAIDQARIG